MANSTQPKGLPFVSLAILVGLLALAIDALHLQLGRIGFDAMAAPLMDPNDDRMRKRFTGVEGIDGFLTTLLIMFQTIFTGEMPELSLFSFHFAGQFASALTLQTVQGLRYGTRRNIVRFTTLWAVIMQVVGYGVIMPLYYILDLVFSSHVPADLAISDPARLHAIVPAFLIGFVGPSALQTIPVKQDLHQTLLAVWQPFPIYVGILLWTFSQVFKRLVPTGGPGKKSIIDKEAVDHAYGFSISVGALTHWITLGVILAAHVVPDVFPAGVAEHLTLSKVFVPHAVHWYGPGTIASTIFQFLQYDQYIGAGAGVVWAATLAHRSGIWSPNVDGFRRIVRDVLVLGPPSAAISLLWSRDDAVYSSQ